MKSFALRNIVLAELSQCPYMRVYDAILSAANAISLGGNQSSASANIVVCMIVLHHVI